MRDKHLRHKSPKIETRGVVAQYRGPEKSSKGYLKLSLLVRSLQQPFAQFLDSRWRPWQSIAEIVWRLKCKLLHGWHRSRKGLEYDFQFFEEPKFESD